MFFFRRFHFYPYQNTYPLCEQSMLRIGVGTVGVGIFDMRGSCGRINKIFQKGYTSRCFTCSFDPHFSMVSRIINHVKVVYCEELEINGDGSLMFWFTIMHPGQSKPTLVVTYANNKLTRTERPF